MQYWKHDGQSLNYTYHIVKDVLVVLSSDFVIIRNKNHWFIPFMLYFNKNSAKVGLSVIKFLHLLL